MVRAMKSSFWLLDAPRNQRPLVVAEGTAFTRTPCPANDRHGMIKRVGDLHVVAHPSGLKDFTWTWMSDLLISPKVLALFEHHSAARSLSDNVYLRRSGAESIHKLLWGAYGYS